MPGTFDPVPRPSRPPIPSFEKARPAKYGWVGGPEDAPVIVTLTQVNNLLLAQMVWLTFSHDGTPAIAVAELVSQPANDGKARAFRLAALRRSKLGWRDREDPPNQVSIELRHEQAITIGNTRFELRPAMIAEVGTTSAGTIKQVTEDLQMQWSPGLPFLHSYILIRRGGWAWDLGLPDVARGVVEFRRPVRSGGAVEPTFVFPLSDLNPPQGILP